MHMTPSNFTGCSSSCDLRAGERLPKQRPLGDEHPERIPEEQLGAQVPHQVEEAGSIVLQNSRSSSVFENDSKEKTTSAAAKKNEECLDKDAEILRLEERRSMLLENSTKDSTKTEKDDSEHEMSDDKRIPEITSEELQSAISKLKAGKSPDGNGIRAEDIKDCNDETREMMRQIFNEVIKRKNFTPEEWKKVKIKVIYKKGDVEDVSNYRPICSLPAMYTLFSTILYGSYASSSRRKENTKKLKSKLLSIRMRKELLTRLKIVALMMKAVMVRAQNLKMMWTVE